MIALTKEQENRFRVTLFRARYKSLKNEGLPEDERFVQAIVDTADDKINLDEHQEIIEEWLASYTKGKLLTR